MASILDRYGIKEVADVTFYELDANGAPDRPVLYLDTLKVSTIEQTAESVDATGGKGNAALISWDYGKEITVTLEDALFSPKSLAIMFGNGLPVDYDNPTTGTPDPSSAFIMRTETFTYDASASDKGWKPYYIANGSQYAKRNAKFYSDKGSFIGINSGESAATGLPTSGFTDGETYFCTYDLLVEGSAYVVEVSANSFPGTYYVTGDTYARSDASGKDEFFQFIIPKAKVQSENTLTLEAEGDPTVFNMNLKVLRPKDGVMMKLVKYNVKGDPATETVSTMYHNHVLATTND
jgi:hypothetical protein